MLLGVLIALGVIILLATPGPWHKVVPVTPRVPAAAPPRDVLVMVTRSTDDRRCAGALWVHVGYETPAVTVVVVPARLTGLLPGAGMTPLSDVVAHAGPAAGAAAAGEALGVTFEGWITVSRAAVDEMLPMPVEGTEGSSRPAARRSSRAWSGSGPLAWAFGIQTRDADRYASSWRPRLFNRGAFINFVLGSPDASTDMKLQTVSALAGAIGGMARGRMTAGALPVVVYANGVYERVRPRPLATLAYRLSFAVDDMTASLDAGVERASASDRVIVLTDADRASRRGFAGALGGVVAAHSANRVRMVVVACSSRDDIERALAERAAGRPPLAAVAAFGAADGATAAETAALVDAASGAAREACLPLVVAVAGGGSSATGESPEAIAAASGFPWVADRAIGDKPKTPDRASLAALGAASGAGRVRAVVPRFFAPRLRATRVGFDYFERGRLEIVVTGTEGDDRTLVVERLAAMGYRPSTSEAGDGVVARVATVHYRSGSRSEALCVADDLGWPRSRVVVDAASPAAVTIVLAAAGVALGG
jgi:hypothetical protein